jgi:hypothetical protein
MEPLNQKRICAAPKCQGEFTPNHGKQMFCSSRCRVATHRVQNKHLIKPEITIVSLDSLKHSLNTFPDKEAIKALCQEILGIVPLQPVILRGPAQHIKIPCLTPPIEDQANTAEPKYLPPRPIINPEADIVHRMVEPPKGSKAYFLRHGDE